MNKKTVIIVSLALVTAILAIAVIATFPSYIFEDTNSGSNPAIQSGNIHSSNSSDSSDLPETQGTDVGNVGDTVTEEETVEVTLPTIDVLPGSSSDSADSFETVAKAESAVLKAQNGSFGDDVKVSLKKLGVFSKEYHRVNHYTSDFAKNLVAYKYSATKDGENYQTSGQVKLVITVPKKYDINNTAVYYLLEDGIKKVASYTNKTDGTISVNAVSTGVYILVEETPSIEDDTSSDTTNSSDSSSDKTENTPSDDVNSNTSSTDEQKDSMEGWSPWF